jgi:hypothetical protein
VGAVRNPPKNVSNEPGILESPKMSSEIVQQGRAAWARLKKNDGDWADWKLVGAALMEGRAMALRNAGVSNPSGGGYSGSFNDWLTYHRFDMPPAQRAKLLMLMAVLPEIERWRLTLTEAQQLRLNEPASVLLRYRKATRIKPTVEHVTSSTAPA